MMQPPFPTQAHGVPPNVQPQTGWYFDRGVEALVFVELDQPGKNGQASIRAWSRPVWEAAGFQLEACRKMPNAPAPIHAALLQDPSRWR